MTTTITAEFDVFGCSGCGKDHESLKAKLHDSNGPRDMRFRATCPNSENPSRVIRIIAIERIEPSHVGGIRIYENPDTLNGRYSVESRDAVIVRFSEGFVTEYTNPNREPTEDDMGDDLHEHARQLHHMMTGRLERMIKRAKDNGEWRAVGALAEARAELSEAADQLRHEVQIDKANQ